MEIYASFVISLDETASIAQPGPRRMRDSTSCVDFTASQDNLILSLCDVTTAMEDTQAPEKIWGYKDFCWGA